MKENKKYYGNAIIKDEILYNTEIKLEYYKTEKDNKYGIQVVKTEVKDKIENSEKIDLEKITEKEDVVDRLLNKILKYKVTPIVVEDIVEDFMYAVEC